MRSGFHDSIMDIREELGLMIAEVRRGGPESVNVR